jgi:hypothetical protein
MQWWNLAIPAVAAIVGVVVGSSVNAWTNRKTAREQAEDRRRSQFIADRRMAYVKFLAAMGEWEPMRERDSKLRAAADQPDMSDVKREEVMAAWRECRALTMPYFRQFMEAQSEISLLAPRRIREIVTYLSVESSRGGATGRLKEEFMQAARLDLGTDRDKTAAGSPLLDEPTRFRPCVPSMELRDGNP